MIRLAPNFTLRELVASQTAARQGITNSAPWWAIENLTSLCTEVLQPIRDHYGRPVVVSSGFRSQALERVLKGMPADWVSHGQHPLGQAADFEVLGLSNADVARWIRANLAFDQLILEFHNTADPSSGWIHCSYVRPNRTETLTAVRHHGDVTYQEGLPSLVTDPEIS